MLIWERLNFTFLTTEISKCIFSDATSNQNKFTDNIFLQNQGRSNFFLIPSLIHPLYEIMWVVFSCSNVNDHYFYSKIWVLFSNISNIIWSISDQSCKTITDILIKKPDHIGSILQWPPFKLSATRATWEVWITTKHCLKLTWQEFMKVCVVLFIDPSTIYVIISLRSRVGTWQPYLCVWSLLIDHISTMV